jgi:DNA-binding NarL/FixJ family response regulator
MTEAAGRDDLAALRGRIQHRIEAAQAVAADAEAVLSGLRVELADLPIPGTRLYPTDDLSPRELEVLDRLSKGWSVKRICAELFIAPATTKNHIQACIEKLHVHSRLDAVLAAQRGGLL